MAVNGLEMRRRLIASQPHLETVSGAVASFVGERLPLKSCKTSVDPVQDLHGYDSPWPAGGGVNKWDEECESGTLNISTGAETTATNQIRAKNYIAVSAGETYYVLANPGVWFLFYDENKSVLTSGLPTGQQAAGNARMFQNLPLTIPDGCNFVRFYFQTSYGTTYKNDTAINYPSTVTTYTPYSNICPITGWTGAKVTRTDKNLLEPKFYTGFIYGKSVGEVFANSVVDVTESVTKNGSVYSKTGRSWNIPMCMLLDIESLVGQTITLSGFFSGSLNVSNGLRSAWVFTDSNYRITRKMGSWNGNPPWTLTPQNGEKYIVWFINSSASGTIELNQPMIELGSTATAYEPYSGTTYSITFPTEAGTVYGGSLDVTTGVLTVDKVAVDLGTLNWNADPNRPGVFYTASRSSTAKVNGLVIADIYAWRNAGVPSAGSLSSADNTISLYPSYGGGYIFVIDTSKASMTNTEFKTAMNGVIACYQLKNPITYQLTPQEITTLIGTNNIWADTGDVSVTYWKH